jgi:hypothetical protein
MTWGKWAELQETWRLRVGGHITEEEAQSRVEEAGRRAREDNARDEANRRPSGGDHRSEAYRITVDTQENDVNSDRPTGNSVAQAHRRLRRDRPDLHARVLAVEEYGQNYRNAPFKRSPDMASEGGKPKTK